MRGLVINLGLKSMRAIVFDETGTKLASSSRPVHTYLRDTWVEQDPEEWWAKVVECVQDVVQAVESRSIRFVTVTASAACLVPLDHGGCALRRAIMVSDRRATKEAESQAGLRSFSTVRATNGGFAADPYFLAPKAAWIKDNEPEVYGRTRWLLTPGDYLVFRLTDEVVTDPLNAEKFFFDVDRWSYPAEFFREAGLEISHLPPVRPMGTEVGQVTSSSAAALGLVPGVPVVLSTYDAICAFWGSGVREHGDVADVSGTVTSVRVLSEHSATGHAMAIFSQAVPGLGHHVVGGSNNLGGGLVEWLKQSFYATESLAYATMEHEAAASGPGARGILFLPYLLGERCPIWDPHARGVFFGLERQHQRGDFARAVFESAAFGLEHVLRTVREHSIQPAKLRISGGLARIGLVSLIKCDVTGLVTEVVDEFETAALGAYMVAATGCGVFSTLSDAANVARVREVILPNAAREARYREWMDVYLELYARLRPLFAARHELLIRHGISGTERLENL